MIRSELESSSSSSKLWVSSSFKPGFATFNFGVTTPHFNCKWNHNFRDIYLDSNHAKEGLQNEIWKAQNLFDSFLSWPPQLAASQKTTISLLDAKIMNYCRQPSVVSTVCFFFALLLERIASLTARRRVCFFGTLKRKRLLKSKIWLQVRVEEGCFLE